jgi:hypothetical protein
MSRNRSTRLSRTNATYAAPFLHVDGSGPASTGSGTAILDCGTDLLIVENWIVRPGTTRHMVYRSHDGSAPVPSVPGRTGASLSKCDGSAPYPERRVISSSRTFAFSESKTSSSVALHP